MKKIRIEGINGHYIVKNNELIYNYGYYERNEVVVSDLCDLTIYQYNELVDQLYIHYPDYTIDYLEGRFI